MQVVATSRGAPGVPGATARSGGSRVVRVVGEDHVRQHPVGPLPAEQGAQLLGGAGGSTWASPMAVKHESHSHWWG